MKYIKIVGDFDPESEDYSIAINSIKFVGNRTVVGLEVEEFYYKLETFLVAHNSSSLITEMLRYQAIGEKVFIINSARDTRHHDNVIMTHNGDTIYCSKVNKLMETVVPYNTTVIGIDEAQFFDDLVPFVKKYVSRGYKVVVAGLDGDYKQEKFGHILDLIPYADNIEKKYAFCVMCKDGTPGVFTKRIGESKDKIIIGAKDMYMSVCRKCLSA